MRYAIITEILELGLTGCNLKGVNFDMTGLPSVDLLNHLGTIDELGGNRFQVILPQTEWCQQNDSSISLKIECDGG